MVKVPRQELGLRQATHPWRRGETGWQPKAGLERPARFGLVALALIALCLLAAIILTGRDQNRVDIFVNGQRLKARTDLQHKRIYVAAHPFAQALGLTVSYNPRDPQQGILIQGKERFLLLSINTLLCHVDDREPAPGAPVVYIDPKSSSPMIPAEFVSKTFGATVERSSVPERGWPVDMLSGKTRERLWVRW